MGTYGEIVQDFDGFTLVLDTSVGSLSDHAEEAASFAENDARARRFIAQRGAELRRLAQHFRTGAHDRRKLLAHLLLPRGGGPRGPALELALPTPAPEGPAPRGPVLHPRVSAESPIGATLRVHAAPTLPIAWQHRLAADLAWAQLEPGGVFERPQPGAFTRRTLLEVEELLGALLLQALPIVPHRTALRLVAALRANQDAASALAALPAPIPPAQAWSLACTRCGWLVACALRDLARRVDYGADVWAGLAALPPPEASQAARLLVLLLPDARWTAGLADVRAHAPHDDPELTAWLDALTRDPR